MLKDNVKIGNVYFVRKGKDHFFHNNTKVVVIKPFKEDYFICRVAIQNCKVEYAVKCDDLRESKWKTK